MLADAAADGRAAVGGGYATGSAEPCFVASGGERWRAPHQWPLPLLTVIGGVSRAIMPAGRPAWPDRLSSHCGWRTALSLAGSLTGAWSDRQSLPDFAPSGIGQRVEDVVSDRGVNHVRHYPSCRVIRSAERIPQPRSTLANAQVLVFRESSVRCMLSSTFTTTAQCEQSSPCGDAGASMKSNRELTGPPGATRSPRRSARE